jgi:hypothetical protein
MFASDKTDWVKLDAEVHKATISYIRSCARMGIKHSQQTKDQISFSMKAYHAGKKKLSIT